jgi:hypothetical protein
MRCAAGSMRHRFKENSMIESPSGEKKGPGEADDPFSGSSLLPMLVSGLVLIVLGMIAVVAFS